ncbi:hypothetical protein NXS98_07675 [Fontisphaera persica]|uniref:hypothetical protein n=1 Tax=Fontisphaera persica TaxID=2974023 RepID=UPI0024C096CD|nr:hypothetical protein [Fontisphaera persica]WCJ60988.1 hypothetical protein NXS98_07675 [Fontisphaera persica]
MRVTTIVVAVLAAFTVASVTGCRDNQSTGQGGSEQVSAKDEQALKDVSAKVGITFPTNAVLVNATDGDGRDPSSGFYAWGLFSPTAISMPAMKAPGVNGYLNLPLEDTVKFVQGMMRGRKISQPQTAFSSEWETNGYAFRGTLVRTAQGDYLAVEQFRKK